LARWTEEGRKKTSFQKLRFTPHRFGSDSGSPIEIEIRESDNERRRELAQTLKEKMSQLPALTNVEIDEPISRREYRLTFRDADPYRLDVNPGELSRTLRAYVEGEVLYTFIRGDEEVDVRLLSPEGTTRVLPDILKLYAENARNY